MKLSELKKIAEEKGVTVDDLIDDETGVSFRDMRGRYAKYDDLEKENHTVKQQFEQRGQELNGALNTIHQYQASIEQIRKNNTPGPNATQAQIDRSYRNDVLFATLVPYLDHLENTLATAGQALAGMYQQYSQDRQGMMQYLNAREIDRMKGKYEDFDEQKVTEVAKRHGINDWEGAYRLYREGTESDRIKKVQDETRQATLKELEDKSKAPPVTEMGGGNLPAAVTSTNGGPGGEQKDYNQAWKGLAEEIKGLGF